MDTACLSPLCVQACQYSPWCVGMQSDVVWCVWCDAMVSYMRFMNDDALQETENKVVGTLSYILSYCLSPLSFFAVDRLHTLFLFGARKEREIGGRGGGGESSRVSRPPRV